MKMVQKLLIFIREQERVSCAQRGTTGFYRTSKADVKGAKKGLSDAQIFFSHGLSYALFFPAAGVAQTITRKIGNFCLQEVSLFPFTPPVPLKKCGTNAVFEVVKMINKPKSHILPFETLFKQHMSTLLTSGIIFQI